MTFDESQPLDMRVVDFHCSFDFCIRDDLVYVCIYHQRPSLPVCRCRWIVRALSLRGNQSVAQLRLEDPHYIVQNPRYLTIIGNQILFTVSLCVHMLISHLDVSQRPPLAPCMDPTSPFTPTISPSNSTSFSLTSPIITPILTSIHFIHPFSSEYRRHSHLLT